MSQDHGKADSSLTLAGFTGCEWLGMTKLIEGAAYAALKRRSSTVARTASRSTQKRSCKNSGLCRWFGIGRTIFPVLLCCLVEAGVEFVDQFRVVSQRLAQNFCLLFGGRPVLFFDRFRQSWQLKVCVVDARAVEDVFEPWSAGNAVRVHPVAFDLHSAVIDGLG